MRATLRARSFACVRRMLAAGIVIFGQVECKVAARAVAAPPDQKAIDAAVEKGIVSLRKTSMGSEGGRATIAGQALIEAGEPVDSPAVQRVLGLIVGKIKDGKYTPSNSHEHGYESGLDAITLESADPEKYRDEIESIAKYLMGVQNAGGDWNYPNTPTGGDTSITQYGVLGLWAAARAGIEVPGEVWDKVAGWHVSTQGADGGFTYHPSPNSANPQIGVTAAGSASLHVCRMYLYPNADLRSLQRPEAKKPAANPSGRKFGVLELAPVAPPPGEAKAGGAPRRKGPPPKYEPKTSLDRIDKSINGGLEWITGHFTIENPPTFKHYYLYSLERLSALADVTHYGEHDWYEEGAEHLVATQNADGSWSGQTGIADTAFSLLFLIRATNKMLDRKDPPRRVGAGILAGGRGLPDNLAAVGVKDGKVTARKVQGEIDELLNSLENSKSSPLESVQSAIVEKIQLGDREALIGQVDRLKKLATHPQAEVRRTALWALGRSRDLTVVPLLLAGLEDGDVDVVVESHNALCYLARKPLGLGSPLNPLEGLDEDATLEAKTAALRKWQEGALRDWKAWHFRVRPYDERNDLTEPRAAK